MEKNERQQNIHRKLSELKESWRNLEISKSSISQKKFIKWYETHLENLLEVKKMIGQNPFKNLIYSQLILDSVKVIGTWSQNYQRFLKSNPSIWLLINEIDGSLNPYVIK